MDIKGSLVIGASIVVASIVLGLTAVPKSPASGSAPAAGQCGRFQLSAVPGRAFVLDTATGEVWVKLDDGRGDDTFSRIKIK